MRPLFEPPEETPKNKGVAPHFFLLFPMVRRSILIFRILPRPCVE